MTKKQKHNVEMKDSKQTAMSQAMAAAGLQAEAVATNVDAKLDNPESGAVEYRDLVYDHLAAIVEATDDALTETAREDYAVSYPISQELGDYCYMYSRQLEKSQTFLAKLIVDAKKADNRFRGSEVEDTRMTKLANLIITKRHTVSVQKARKAAALELYEFFTGEPWGQANTKKNNTATVTEARNALRAAAGITDENPETFVMPTENDEFPTPFET